MRVRLVGFLAALLVAGCSASDEPPESTEAPPSVPTLALVDACPEIEAGLPSGVLPEPSEWQAYQAELENLSDAGDTETKNALDLLTPAVETLAANPGPGDPLLDARSALRAALDSLSDRCAAVGSSALQ